MGAYLFPKVRGGIVAIQFRLDGRKALVTGAAQGIGRAVAEAYMEFGAAEYAEPSLVFYFRKHVRGFMTYLKVREVADYMARAGPRFVIVPTNRVDELPAGPRATWKRLTMDGFNLGRMQSVSLTMFLKGGQSD